MTGPHNATDRAAGEASASLSTELLVGLKDRQGEAWRRLLRLYGPVVYGWCKGNGLQAPDAEDVVQEVFRTVLMRIADFRRERPGDTFRGWLWTITRFKIGDHLRRRASQPRAAGGSEAREQLEQVPADSLGESSEVSPGLTRSLYRRALDLIRGEFEEVSWQAFWRVVGESHRPADVAAELGISLNAVYLAKSRILRRLREALGDAPEER